MSSTSPPATTPQNGFARGWRYEIKNQNAIMEVLLSTDGHIYYLPVSMSVGAAAASQIGRQFGILGAVVGSVASNALQNKANEEGRAKQDSMTLSERMGQSPRACRKIPSVIIERFFAGEKGFGFGKERNGIYFRPGIPPVTAPRGLWKLTLPEDDLGWTAAMKGWCDATGVRCEGFAIGEAPDPVWLEGPQVGEVAGTAAEAFDELARNVGAMRDQVPLESLVAAAGASAGSGGSATPGKNPMAMVSVGLGAFAGVLLFFGFVASLAMPGMGSVGSCLTFPMSVVGVVLGAIALKKATDDPFGTGKTLAIAGLALGVVMFFGSVIVPMIGSFLGQFLHSL